MVSNETPYNITSKELGLEIMPIKIEHKLKKIHISDNLNNKKDGIISFHIEEGFPISLFTESFLIFLIRCKHNIVNKIKIPIESVYEWRIMDGLTTGAIKHNSGMDTKYSDSYFGNNCAIYFPPRGKLNNPIGTRKVRIGIKIGPVFLEGRKKNSTTTKSVRPDEIFNMVILDFEQKREYLLEMFLGKLGGFRNRNSYEVRLQYQSMLNEAHFENNETSVHTQTESETCIDYYPYGQVIDENTLCFTYNDIAESCVICNIKLNLKSWHNLGLDKVRINLDNDRFFTSEYVSLSTNLFDIVKAYEDAFFDEKTPFFEIENNSKSTLKFRILNCPILKITDIIWSTTGGTFPCGNKGNSVIFQSPQEKDLRKSPLTLSISGIFPSSTLDTSSKLVDQRKILLIRKMVFGG